MSKSKTGKNHPGWKGGYSITKGGYKIILVSKKKYVLEHRYIIEKHLGRKLLEFPQEVIHHIDGNKLNNSIDNLQVISASNHAKIHNNLYETNKIKSSNKITGTIKECKNCNNLRPVHNVIRCLCRPCYRKLYLNNV